MASEREPGPILVLVAELGSMPELTNDRPDGGTYERARVFFTARGRLAGQLDLTFESGHITAARLESAASDLIAAWDCPASLAVTSEAIPNEVVPEEALPYATIAVPTVFARGDALDRAIKALAAQNYPADRYEVLVVDNRPRTAWNRDEWAKLEHLHPRVRVIGEAQPGASAARNRALRHAKGDIIAFTDDDASADVDWLRHLARRFVLTPEADCVTGSVLPAELETAAQVWFEESGSAPNRRFTPALFMMVGADINGKSRRRFDRFMVADRYASSTARPFSIYALGDMGTGSNMAFRVGALRDLGGFDEALGPGTVTTAGGEDILAFLQVLANGRGIAVEPDAWVMHWHRRTYAELRQQIHGYGRSFTAMLIAAILDNPRHLWELCRVVPTGLLAMAGVRSEKTTGRSDGYPRDLHRAELVGMLGGPFAYARSRLRARADRRALLRGA